MKIPMILILFLLIGCGQNVSEKRDPKQTPQIDELLDSPVAVFQSEMNEMNDENRGGILPKLNEWIEYDAEFSITKTLNFDIKEGDDSFKCEYSYKKAKINEKITKVEIKDYMIRKTYYPIEPTFTGAEILNWKTKCLAALNNGAYFRDYPKSIDAQTASFKKFVRVNLIDSFQSCLKRKPPTFYTCEVDKIEVTKKSNGNIEYYNMIFQGRVKGQPIGILASVNFEKIYFSNFGVFGFSFDSLNTSGFSYITKITLKDWRH
jgi:hypothetical protein